MEPQNSEAVEETLTASVVFTIYCHTHVESGRRYIGQTKKTWKQRWNRHVFEARHVKSGYGHFHNAIRKYGKDAFSHEILEICKTIESSNIAEQKWISHFHSNELEFGFNLTRGGSHTPHPIKNPWDRPEFRAKALANLPKLIAAGQTPQARAASKAAINTPEVRQKLSAATSRQFSSEESRTRMSGVIRALHQDPDVAPRFRKGLETANRNRASKTHCVNGHEFTTENTNVDDNGWRYCKQCQSDRVSQKTYDSRTHCANDHEFSGENIKFSKNGRSRICLKCLPTVCRLGHLLNDKPETFRERGCYRCKLERARTYDAARRLKRKTLGVLSENSN